MRRRPHAALLGCLIAWVGCDAFSPTYRLDGGSSDASPPDAGHDVGVELDAGTERDGGELDAGPVDSGPRDASQDSGRTDGGAVDAGPSCPPEALVCDDFESGVADNPPWDFSTTPQWSTTRARGGSRSLFVDGSRRGDQSFLAFENRADPSNMHLRFWLYVPASAQIDDLVLLQLSTEGSDMTLQAANDRFAFRDNRTTGMSYPGELVPRDRWMCISMRLTSGATPRVVVGLDGTTMIDRTLASALAPTDARFVGLGLVYMGLSQDGLFEAFIDDFAWGDEALPCP